MAYSLRNREDIQLPKRFRDDGDIDINGDNSSENKSEFASLTDKFATTKLHSRPTYSTVSKRPKKARKLIRSENAASTHRSVKLEADQKSPPQQEPRPET